ncbi:MAG TPA: RsmG family class I SAM-dependent methyltransferase, partial [Bdellovibrionales bacterium]|nr:RsmG family class I SAM-dependent methyltransferase [Bdellovibrionales bacterium]
MEKKPQFRIPGWFPDLKPETQNLLSGYFRELLRFNKTINLVSPRSLPDADRLHFADSILGGQIVLNDNTAEVIHDLGSGNGFPGMV